jgi:hypothetical protein
MTKHEHEEKINDILEMDHVEWMIKYDRKKGKEMIREKFYIF